MRKFLKEGKYGICAFYTIVRILIVSLLIFSCSSSATEQKMENFPEMITIGKDNLILNGHGKKEATFFLVEVYKVGLYLPKKTKDLEAILNINGHVLLRFEFFLQVKGKKLAASWQEDLRGACEKECDKILMEAKLLGEKLPNIKKSTIIDYEISPLGVKVTVNQKEIGWLRERKAGQYVLLTLIGKHSPGKLRSALLGI